MQRSIKVRQIAIPCCALSLLVLFACEDDGVLPTGPESPSAPSAAVVTLEPLLVNAPITFVGAGDIAHCTGTGDERTAAILDTIPGYVFTTGDNVYETGTAAEYANCYEPSWGRHKSRTWASIGNHEYESDPTAAPTFAYFGDRIGPPGKGYYSFNLGEWHVVVLNTNRTFVPYAAGSEQEKWLKADLAANTKKCLMAIWHHPRFYSGSASSTGVDTKQKILWDYLYAAGADLILTGHHHHYERFAPMDPDGNVDPQRGIRQFIIGTGGKSYGFPERIHPNSELVWGGYGVLKLTLEDTRYSWKFIPVPKMQPIDESGSGTCHNASTEPNTPPTADAGSQRSGVEGAAVTFDGSASTDPDGNLPLSYAWDFGDGTTGSGVSPSHVFPDNGSYTVTLRVTDSRGATSAPATTTAVITNAAPTVDMGGSRSVLLGTALNASGSFSDAGSADGPWSYTFAWGDGTQTSGTTSDASAPLSASHTYAAAGQYTVVVSVTDKDGGRGQASFVATVSTTPPPSSVVLVGAGNIARCDRGDDEATAALLDGITGTVFALGDLTYGSSSATEIPGCYGPSWGRHRARTRPVIGHKEYTDPGASTYFSYFGSAAGEPGKGYYSYDVGDWHVVVLNSISEEVPTGATSAQVAWLKADLAASTKQCTIALWDRPRFYSAPTASATGLRSETKAFWDVLYAAGVELVVNGHQYTYERFAPQTPDGVADPVKGIRQFIVGTGGQRHDTIGMVRANSERRDVTSYGVLKLTLSANGYSWEFLPASGGTFTDAGSGACH